MLKITKKLYVTTAIDWRRWLKKNYKKALDIWLIYPNVKSGKPRIAYNDAVEEALCFGWIDSTVKNQGDSSLQRFSPRRKNSSYSQPNIERLKRMAAKGKLMPEVKSIVAHLLKKRFVFPKDIMEELKKNKKAYKNFKNYPPAYQRIRVAFIEDARKVPAEFKKRLKNFLTKTEQNKQFGHGIEKFF